MWKRIIVLSVAALLLLLFFLTGCGEKKTVTEDGARETETTAPEAEPETKSAASGKVAYIDKGDVWITDLDGKGKTNITNSPEVETNPRISPDGTRVSFTRKLQRQNVFVTGIDGTGTTRLTEGTPGDDLGACWSPDGETIAFLSTRDMPEEPLNYAEVYLMNPDGTGQRRLSHIEYGLENPEATWWSPDGAQIAVCEKGTGGGTCVSLVDAESGSVTEPGALDKIMATKGYKGPCQNSYVVNPADSNMVACSLFDLGGDPAVDTEKNGLFLVDLTSGAMNRISGPEIPSSAAWSSDGSMIYFTGTAGGDVFSFYSADRSGSGKKKLEGLPAVRIESEYCVDFHVTK